MENKSSSLFKNVMLLSGSSAFARIIPFIILPILTRIFTLEDFGVYGIFFAIIDMLSTTGTYKYDLAIVPAKTEKEYSSLYQLNLILLLINSLIIALVINFFADIIFFKLGIENLLAFKWLIVVGFILNVHLFTIRFILIKNNKYKEIATNNIIVSAGRSIGPLILGLMGKNSAGHLVAGRLLGPLSVTLHYFISCKKLIFGTLLKNFDFRNILYTAKKNIRYPLFNFPTAILNIFSEKVPLLLLSSLFGVAVVGLYSQAAQLLLLNIQILGTSFGSVFLKQLSDLHNNGKDITKYIQKSVVIMSQIAVPLIMFAIVSPELIALFLGAEWYESGMYIRVLVPWVVLSFILVSITNHIYIVLELQNKNLIFTAMLAFVRIISLLIGNVLVDDPVIIIGFFSLANCFVLLLSFTYIFKKAGINLPKMLFKILGSFLYGLPAVIVLLLAKIFLENSNLIVILSTLISILIYFLIQFLFNKDLKNFLKNHSTKNK